MAAAWNPAPVTGFEVKHRRDINDAFQFGLFIQEIRLNPVLMVPADGRLPACGLQQLVEGVENVALKSVDVFLVASALSKTWAMLCVGAYILAIEKIAEQHTRVNVCAMAFNEIEYCRNALATMNWIVNVCENHV